MLDHWAIEQIIILQSLHHKTVHAMRFMIQSRQFKSRTKKNKTKKTLQNECVAETFMYHFEITNAKIVCRRLDRLRHMDPSSRKSFDI